MPSVPVDTQQFIGSLFSHCLHQGWAFASYRLPGDSEPEILLQRNPSGRFFPKENRKKGFVFFPFDPSNTHVPLYIEPDWSFRGWSIPALPHGYPSQLNGFNFSMPHCPVHSMEKGSYLQKLEKAISDLDQSPSLKKVVLTRPLRQDFARKPDVGILYAELCSTYPDAYVYTFFHPLAGLWMGATPEQLLSVKGRNIEMVALAGTRMALEHQNWNHKERDEQSIVTHYIIDVLKEFTDGKLQVQGPYPQQAGAITHLKTEVSSQLSKASRVSALLETLHPTPAVCGFPKQEAQKWIRTHEGYDRAYYTGYLGNVSSEEDMDLFVNLRCMQLFEDAAVLYVGGGITALSEPLSEWNETEAKAGTLLKVLGPYLHVHA